MSSCLSASCNMAFLFRRGSSVYKVDKLVRSFVQGIVLSNKTMGSTYSRSYSPKSKGSKPDDDTCGCSNQGTISRMESTDNFVEAVVCKKNDLKDNEMKVFDVEDGKVLLIKQKGEFSAIGTKCTHYGAPLVNGALGDGRVRCPWHGACFNIKTGDIEDFPGFDSLPCYQVTVTEKGEVKVRAKLSDLKSNVRVKDMGVATECEGHSVVVVGGGPSGATCAETLRSEGFRGRITIIAKEPYLPYDRIKVSKIGAVPDISTLQARTQEYYDKAHINVLKGTEVTSVDIEGKLVNLSDGTHVNYTSLYLAPGCRARVPDTILGIELKNVFSVRNYEDAVKILGTIGEEKDKDVVVLGLGFIGLETAASCASKAKSLTVVGTDTLPLGQIFGATIGQRLKELFEEKGVGFYFRTSVRQCHGEDGVLNAVELTDGVTLKADMLVVGVGIEYNTGFLSKSGIDMMPNGAVLVNDRLETNVKGVYAGGDIASAPVFAAGGQRLAIGHVGLAQYHGRMAALNILKRNAPLHTVPFFWTMLFGKSIRYAGYGKPASWQVEGDVAEMKFVIFFFDEAEKVIAVASCTRDPVVAQFAELLQQGRTLYKTELKGDPFAWTKTIN